MKALAEAGGEFENAVVGQQDNDIAGGVEDSRADFAGFEVAVDFGAQFGVNLAVDVGGDLFPDVLSIDLHLAHPKSPLRRGTKPFNLGARSR